MALLRQASASLRTARRSTIPSPRLLSSTSRRCGGRPEYDPPTGWFLGIKPGEKREPEGWEWPMAFFAGSLILTGVAYAFQPDTS
ncbi:hypothetical protein CDD82_1942 [Ophiocordyceps australis]|uniref:NADH dehydrogenase [ubiquinone] 1 beta subcomplex subunit 11, mitochondrial n=1 Tax=Ophiocordyceps australis TaxID=1399860 RepID=A0A2C5Y2Y3_9HYPO|nr:hypothetical protein CDD82_1942 [Ophiocordyceps australis]